MESKLLKIEEQLRLGRENHAEKRAHLLSQHLEEREALLKRRYELVSGQSAATEAELQGFKGPRTTGPIKPQGVPCFWLNVLCAMDEVSRSITAADRAALAYLQDVRFLRGGGRWQGMMLEFHFSENPFFENLVLRRGLSITRGPNGQLVDLQEEATIIDWHEGQNLTVKVAKVQSKKGKKKGGKKRAGKGGAAEEEGEEGATMTRVKPVPSFFRFFTPLHRRKVVDPTALEDDNDEDEDPVAHLLEEPTDEGAAGTLDEDSDGGAGGGGRRMQAVAAAAQRKVERDMALIDLMVRRVLPRAVHLYLAAPQGSSPEDEDESGYTMVSSGAAAAHGGGAALPEAAQQALHALQLQQTQLDAMCAQLKQANWNLAKELDEAEQKLLDARAEILRGTGGRSPMPQFWLRALRACELTEACVARRDELALTALTDVRARCDWSHMPTRDEPWRKVTVEWVFSDNPYFPATTLSKVYTFTCADGSVGNLSLDQAGQILNAPAWISTNAPRCGGEEGEEGAAEEGRPGRCDLTLDPPAGTGKAGSRPQPATSFFNLFKKGCLRYTFSGLEATAGNLDEAALAAEGQLVGVLMGGPLRYGPCALYHQVEIEEDDLGHEWNELDEEEEEEEEDGEAWGSDTGEGEESEGTGEGKESGFQGRPRRRKAQQQAASGSWWPGKGAVFTALILLMVFAQIVVYIEMWTR